MLLSSRGNMGLRVIVFMGAATFLFLMLMAFGLRKSLQPPAGQQVPSGTATSPFSEERVLASFEALRAPGLTPDARQEYIARSLRSAGLKTRSISWEGLSTGAPQAGSAILGQIAGNRPGRILLCSALDQPSAESAAADAAWLLEMARILGDQRDGREIGLLFLDGAHTQSPDKPDAGVTTGSSLREALNALDPTRPVDAVIEVRGIGDCNLAAQKDGAAPADLSEILWNTAARQGYAKFFRPLPVRSEGAWRVFQDAGVPALLLSDVSYASENGHNSTGTKSGGICPESLRAVGDVIYHALPPLEGHLDETGKRSDGH